MMSEMISILKEIGSEWHKGSMHRFYIDLAKADDLYRANNETFEHGSLPINRREKMAGKVWFDLTADEIELVAQNVSDAAEVIASVMELINKLIKDAQGEETENAEAAQAEDNDTENNEEEAEMEHRIWYAVMRDLEDNDWGTGSFDLDEATRRVKQMRANEEPDAYIAVIDDGDVPVCVDEIHDFDD